MKRITYPNTNLMFDLGSIEKQIKESGFVPDYIVGVVRGGCVPAVYLSHRLKVPVQMVHWSTRDEGVEGNESNYWIPEDLQAGKKILLVEDIIDTGLSIKTLLADWQSSVFNSLPLENIRICSLIFNENNIEQVKADYYGRLHAGHFAVFPWEI